MSLRDFFRGPMTHFELINLIMQLPPGCPLDRAMNGEAADWKVTDHLLAVSINETRLYRSGKRQLPESRQIKPPGIEPAKAKANGHKQIGGAAELDALFTGGG